MNVRDLEGRSIRSFVQSAATEGYLSGRVLDYGCGKQPYRDIVEAAGGSYEGFDRAEYPANVSGEDIGPGLGFGVTYDAVLFTQVIQYALDPAELLANIANYTVADAGVLVMTYPTNWPEVEEADRWRFTRSGMEALLSWAGFTVLRHERRAVVNVGSDSFALGYGVVARA